MTLKLAAAAVLAGAMLAPPALAQGFLVAPNGLVALGVNNDGTLNTNAALAGRPATLNAGVGTALGIAYNFSGQGGRTGWYDALAPGCLCESWGVAGNGIAGSAYSGSGVIGLTIGADSFVPGTSITTAAALSGLPGLTVTHTYTLGAATGTGALFQAEVVITNTTPNTISDVRYARAMDWDIPPTEFREYVTHVGVPTTSALLHATDNGFANANPIFAATDGGIAVPPNTEGSQGLADHGSLFVFGFGELAAGESYTFNIFYGAGADLADALTLLSLVGPELYSLGQSDSGTGPANDLPTFVFAFNGVGGSIVVPPPPPPPPTGVPAPGAFGLFGLALLGFGAALRRRG